MKPFSHLVRGYERNGPRKSNGGGKHTRMAPLTMPVTAPDIMETAIMMRTR